MRVLNMFQCPPAHSEVSVALNSDASATISDMEKKGSRIHPSNHYHRLSYAGKFEIAT